MARRSLVERILAVAHALADVPHAFGGALALAYWAEPRATVDIDLNVFVPVDRATEVLVPLGHLGVAVDGVEDVVVRDGQVRVWWDETPLDLFFAYDAFHDAAGAAAVTVPFADATIRVLAAEHLVVCKVVFDRPKDWVDVHAVRAAGTTVDVAEVLRWVGRVCGDADPRYDRIAAVFTS